MAVHAALRCADGVHCAVCAAVLESQTAKTPSGATTARWEEAEDPGGTGEKAAAVAILGEPIQIRHNFSTGRWTLDSCYTMFINI